MAILKPRPFYPDTHISITANSECNKVLFPISESAPPVLLLAATLHRAAGGAGPINPSAPRWLLAGNLAIVTYRQSVDFLVQKLTSVQQEWASLSRTLPTNYCRRPAGHTHTLLPHCKVATGKMSGNESGCVPLKLSAN